VIVRGHGLAIDVPAGWEARIVRRAQAGPVLHVATFALHEGDGDFGAAATGRMRPDDRFLALIEYVAEGPLQPGHGLFGTRARPQPAWHEFSANQLQVTRRGYLGWQRFFTDAGRPLCAYAVIRPGATPVPRLVADLGQVLATLRFE
jgi:hypothetical protein